MPKRFTWNTERDRILSGRWLTTEPSDIAKQLGCSRRSVYKRAGELDLGPRDKVARAIWQGQAPRDRSAITLPHVPLLDRPFDDCPTTDELAGIAAGGSELLPSLASAGGSFPRVRA